MTFAAERARDKSAHQVAEVRAEQHVGHGRHVTHGKTYWVAREGLGPLEAPPIAGRRVRRPLTTVPPVLQVTCMHETRHEKKAPVLASPLLPASVHE